MKRVKCPKFKESCWSSSWTRPLRGRGVHPPPPPPLKLVFLEIKKTCLECSETKEYAKIFIERKKKISKMSRVFLHAALHNVFYCTYQYQYIVIFNLSKKFQEIYNKEGKKGKGKNEEKGRNAFPFFFLPPLPLIFFPIF